MKKKHTKKMRWKGKQHGKRMVPRYIQNREMRIKRNHTNDMFARNTDDEKDVDGSQYAVYTLIGATVRGAERGVHSVSRLRKKREKILDKDKKSPETIGAHSIYAPGENKYATRFCGRMNNRIRDGRNSVKYRAIDSFLQKTKCRRIARKSYWKILGGTLGGGICVCVMITAMLGMLAASPFSILFYNEIDNGEGMTLEQAMESAENEFVAYVERQIDDLEAGSVSFCSIDGTLKIENWNEIIAVFAVRSGMEQRIIMDKECLELLKDTMNDMVCLEIMRQVDDVGIDDKEDSPVVYITIKYENIISVATKYGFTKKEIEMVMKLVGLNEIVNARTY